MTAHLDRSVEVTQKFVDWYPDTFVIVNKTMVDTVLQLTQAWSM